MEREAAKENQSKSKTDAARTPIDRTGAALNGALRVQIEATCTQTNQE